jgi:hypothetical protein
MALIRFTMRGDSILEARFFVTAEGDAEMPYFPSTL